MRSRQWSHVRPRVGALLGRIGLLVAAGVMTGARPGSLPQVPARPYADKLQPCRVAPLEEQLFCGTFRVPEDRTRPRGRTIALNIVVMPSLAAAPDADPVVYLAGGGVTAATRYVGMLDRVFRQLRERRDILLVDQRGTGGSNPLECAAVGPLPPPSGLPAYVAAVRSCAAELQRRADLRQYTTSPAMDDLDAVRAWLGYERLNLMGVSYGTWAAQVYLRQHPSHVRSVTLLGPMPIDVPMFVEIPRNAQEALDRVLGACEQDAACRRGFPEVRRELQPALQRLAEAPRSLEVRPEEGAAPVRVLVDDRLLIDILYAALGSGRSVGDIPQFIHAAFEGRLEPIAELAAQELAAPPPPVPPAPKGVFLSLLCAEMLPRMSPGDIGAATAGSFLGDYQLRSQLAQCGVWPAARVARSFRTPVRTDLPVLVMAGTLDHTTPPRYGERLVANFPHGRFIEMPGRGHMDADRCVAGIVASFLVSGSTDGLDTACLAATPPIRFRGVPPG